MEWETPVRRQSEHLDDYAAALERLRAMGVLYRCFRTRREVLAAMAGAPQAGDPVDALAFTGSPLAPAEERERLARGEPFAWRLSLSQAERAVGGFARLSWTEEGAKPGLKVADPWPLGDVVIGRKDIGASYLLASVVDDALQGITHVIRGEDLAEATAIQRVLQALLGLPTPLYRHHRLLLGPDGKRLSKRDGAMALRSLRAEGVTPEQVRARLGFPPRA